jgi:hypothetical protein
MSILKPVVTEACAPVRFWEVSRIGNDKRALFRQSGGHQLRPRHRRDADFPGLSCLRLKTVLSESSKDPKIKFMLGAPNPKSASLIRLADS